MKKLIVFTLLFIIILTTNYSVFASASFIEPNTVNIEILNVPNDIKEINILLETSFETTYFNVPLSNLQNNTLHCTIDDKSLSEKPDVKIVFTNNKDEKNEVKLGNIFGHMALQTNYESILPPKESSVTFSYNCLTDKTTTKSTYIPSISINTLSDFVSSYLITLVVILMIKYIIAFLFKINYNTKAVCISFLIHTIIFILKFIFELFLTNHIIPILLIIPLMALLEYVLFRKTFKEYTNKKILLYIIITNLCSYIISLYYLITPILSIHTS